jgi:hypothetical protein
MGPIGRMGRTLAALLAGGVEPLREGAFIQELLLQSAGLAVEEVVGLVEQADQGVGSGVARTRSAASSSSFAVTMSPEEQVLSVPLAA